MCLAPKGNNKQRYNVSHHHHNIIIMHHIKHNHQYHYTEALRQHHYQTTLYEYKFYPENVHPPSNVHGTYCQENFTKVHTVHLL